MATLLLQDLSAHVMYRLSLCRLEANLLAFTSANDTVAKAQHRAQLKTGLALLRQEYDTLLYGGPMLLQVSLARPGRKSTTVGKPALQLAQRGLGCGGWIALPTLLLFTCCRHLCRLMLWPPQLHCSQLSQVSCLRSKLQTVSLPTYICL